MIKLVSKENVTQCNLCGADLDEFDLNNNFSMRMNIGYGSEFDGDELTMTLCCKCMDKLIKSCKVSPVKGLYKYSNNE